MTPIRRIACPSCKAGLKIAATLPAQKRIRCPKCNGTFPQADARDWVPPARSAHVVRRPPASASKDNEDLEKDERCAAPEQADKKTKPALRQPLVLGLAIGGTALLLAAAVTLAVVRPWEAKKGQVTGDSVAAKALVRPGRVRRAADPGPSATRAAPGNGKAAGQPAPSDAVVGEALPAPAGKEPADAGPMAAGQKVFEKMDCGRCHAIGPGGGFKKAGRGPNLVRVGANPAHTVEWLSDQIRDPQSHRPGSRMPPYEDKISREDLRSLAEYLASLK